jgi:hypothetical protein
LSAKLSEWLHDADSDARVKLAGAIQDAPQTKEDVLFASASSAGRENIK